MSLLSVVVVVYRRRSIASHVLSIRVTDNVCLLDRSTSGEPCDICRRRWTYVLDAVRLIAIVRRGDKYIENSEQSDIFDASPTSTNRSDRSLWRRQRGRNEVASLRHGRSFRGQVLGRIASLSSTRRQPTASVRIFGCRSHFLVRFSSSFSSVFSGS